MGYNENYIEPWCQCFVECHLPASIGQDSKVFGTASENPGISMISGVFLCLEMNFFPYAGVIFCNFLFCGWNLPLISRLYRR